MREEDDQRREAECPRCGYDLTGETDRWTDACPLESVCPECGWAVRWSSVFGPMQAIPRWSVERPNARPRRAYPATFFRSLRPARFWGGLEMTAHARLWSLAWYAVISACVVTLLAAIPEVAIDLNLGYLHYHFTPSRFAHHAPKPTMAAVCQTASMIVGPFGTVWWTWHRGVNFYIEWVLLLPPLFVALCPLAYLCLPTTLNACKVRKTHIVRAFLLGVPIAMLACETLFLVHTLLFQGWSHGQGSWIGRAIDLIEPLATAGVLWMLPLIALQWCWWHAVNRRYLRLPNPRAVTAAMLAIAALATLIPLFGFTQVGVALYELLTGAV